MQDVAVLNHAIGNGSTGLRLVHLRGLPVDEFARTGESCFLFEPLISPSLRPLRDAAINWANRRARVSGFLALTVRQMTSR